MPGLQTPDYKAFVLAGWLAGSKGDDSESEGSSESSRCLPRLVSGPKKQPRESHHRALRDVEISCLCW